MSNYTKLQDLPLFKLTNDPSLYYIIEGTMFELISPQHESYWKGSGEVEMQCTKIGSEKYSQPVSLCVSGDFVIFDRFLNFSMVIEKSNNKFFCWNKLPTPKQFNAGLFASMLCCYSNTSYSEEESLVESYEFLDDYRTNKSTNASSQYKNVSYDIERLEKSHFVQNNVNPNSIYFYYSEFITLIQLYPDKSYEIRHLPDYQRTKLIDIIHNEDEALCYEGSTDLMNNPLGRVSRWKMSQFMKNRGVSEQEIRFKMSNVFFYEQFVLKRYFESSEHASSTRIILEYSKYHELKSSTCYDYLFNKRKVLSIVQLPIDRTENISKSKSLCNYLIDQSSILHCETIRDYIQRIVNKINPLPPTSIRKKQYIQRLGSKDHAKYIQFFGVENDDSSSSDLSDDDDDDDTPSYVYQYNDLSSDAQKVLQTQLHHKQWSAVNSCIEDSMSLVSGGPGTGKTSTVLKTIWESSPLEYLIVAPTGIVVDKIVEDLDCCDVLGEEHYCNPVIETIDYVIELIYHNRNHLLSYTTALIIDESSYIDEKKFAVLLKSLPYLQKLVMIGDVQQLAPIGKGYPFRDVIEIFRKYSHVLTKNFRASSKVLISNANAIVTSNFDKLRIQTSLSPIHMPRTAFLKRSENLQHDVSNLLKYIKTRSSTPEKFLEDTQFITPYNKTRRIVCDVIYRLLFQYNGSRSTYTLFHIGQKIVFLKNYKSCKIDNRYVSSGVKNGESGIITAIRDIKCRNNKNKSARDVIHRKNTHSTGRRVPAGYRRWLRVRNSSGKEKYVDLQSIENNITDGSCITGHKSQGSQYTFVVIVLDYFNAKQAHIVNRNWLYTAFTRAKQSVCILYKDQRISSDIPAKYNYGSCSEIMRTPRAPIDTFLSFYLQQCCNNEVFSLRRMSGSSCSSTNVQMQDDDDDFDFSECC